MHGCQGKTILDPAHRHLSLLDSAGWLLIPIQDTKWLQAFIHSFNPSSHFTSPPHSPKLWLPHPLGFPCMATWYWSSYTTPQEHCQITTTPLTGCLMYGCTFSLLGGWTCTSLWIVPMGVGCTNRREEVYDFTDRGKLALLMSRSHQNVICLFDPGIWTLRYITATV